MNRARFASIILISLTAFILASVAVAQSTISGVVKDSSGAVVSGAKVEASSEVLIERVRAVTTNGEGRYAIFDLRPGSYTITVTMSGFVTVKQTVELPANVSVPVDAELKIGSVGETVNVEARIATVDVENVAHPLTLTRSDMDNLPSGRYMQAIGVEAPGAHLNLPDVGGSQQIEQNYLSVHGNGSTHDTYMLDGMKVNTTYADGQIQQYIDNAAIQETTYQTSNVTADSSGGGMFTNLIPKDGGNTYHLQFFGGGSGGEGLWQADNIDKTLLARGLSQQDKTVKIEDFDGSFGGPIKRDKLWFMLTGREQITFTQAGASTYPDGRPGIQDGWIYAGSLRLTYQATPKNKFSAFWLRNWKYKAHEILDGGQEGFTPADPATTSTQRNKWPMYYILQTKWTGTLTPRLIAEAGVSISHLDYNDIYQPGIQQAPNTPDWYALTTARENTTLRRYFAPRDNQYFQTTRNLFTGSVAYITGSHQFRFGAEDSFGPYHLSVNKNGDGYMVFQGGTASDGTKYAAGLPLSFTANNTPYFQWPKLDADVGIYAMDTWHIKRLAISAGIRWEYLAGEIEEENAQAGRFVGQRVVPRTTCDNVKGMGCWKNWAPRVGIVYDVFGNHKTAIKAGFGKYNTAYSTGFTNNFNPMTGVTQSVTWNVPASATAPGGACVPVTVAGILAPNPKCFPTGGFNGAGALPGVGVGTLGASTNPSFGSVAAGTGVNLDPNWKRDYNLQYTVGIQQEIMRGITANFNWYRRSDYQQTLVVNYAESLSDWTPLTITNPLDGSPITFYNLTKTPPAPNVWQTNAPQSLVKNVYTGYEASVVARPKAGMFFTFAYTLDRDLDRACAMSAGSATAINGNKLNDPNTLRFCDQFGGLNQDLGKVNNLPWAADYKLQAVIPLRFGVVASAGFGSSRVQGGFATAAAAAVNNGWLARTWTLTAASVYPSNCVGCTAGARVFPTGFALGQASETVNLVAPGQVLAPRFNSIDVGFKKTFKFHEKYVLEPTVQIFNLLNANTAITESTSLGGDTSPYLPKSACGSSTVANCGLGGTVTTVYNPRLLRLALMFRF